MLFPWWAGWWRTRVRGDSGFALVELVVALVVFGLVFSAAASAIGSSLDSTRTSRQRVVAANLASRELDFTRNRFETPGQGPTSVQAGQVVNPDPLPGGTAGQALVVDATPFTVTRTAEWVSQGATSGPCDGGSSGQLQYLRVSVSVTWPRMDGVDPVTDATVLTPPLGTYSSSTGHIRVKVIDRSGVPAAGHVVTVSGPGGTQSQTTAADGCAFFAFLATGAWTVGVGDAGDVDPSWDPTPSASASVTAGAVTPVSFAYDRAATVDVAADSGGSGFAFPSGVAVAAANASMPLGFRTVPVTSFPAVVANVWPYGDGVQWWAGNCADSDPQGVDAHSAPYWPGASRGPVVATTPGQVTAASVAGDPVTVTVSSSATGAPVAGATVYAVHAVDNVCPGPVADPVNGSSVGQVLTVPAVTGAAGTTSVLLPYGSWTFEAVSGSGQVRTVGPTVALAPGQTQVTSVTVTQ